MSFDPEFFELMPFSVTYKPKATEDEYGDETYGDPVEIEHARIVTKRRFIRTASGDEREVNTSITTGGYFGVEENGLMILEDGSEHVIQVVETFPDEEGPHHQVVWI